ncbi:MAG: hypothetical protein MR904_04560 [Clostridia bacterium]|nr:hypothetical protein [Clostridia bacterium]
MRKISLRSNSTRISEHLKTERFNLIVNKKKSQQGFSFCLLGANSEI